MIKKYWAYILLAFSVAFFIYKKTEKANSVYSCKTFKAANGWGYEILFHDSVFIKQNTIPGVGGLNGFTTEQDAKKVANFVVQKLNAEHHNFPSVSQQELDSLKVKYK